DYRHRLVLTVGPFDTKMRGCRSMQSGGKAERADDQAEEGGGFSHLEARHIEQDGCLCNHFFTFFLLPDIVFPDNSTKAAPVRTDACVSAAYEQGLSRHGTRSVWLPMRSPFSVECDALNPGAAA